MNDGLSDGIVSAITEFKTGIEGPNVLHTRYCSTPERKSKSPLLQAESHEYKKTKYIKLKTPF
jgi:hypothetical protein